MNCMETSPPSNRRTMHGFCLFSISFLLILRRFETAYLLCIFGLRCVVGINLAKKGTSSHNIVFALASFVLSLDLLLSLVPTVSIRTMLRGLGLFNTVACADPSLLLDFLDVFLADSRSRQVPVACRGSLPSGVRLGCAGGAQCHGRGPHLGPRTIPA